MRRQRLLHISERWFRLLQHLYPPDFREEMGSAVVEAYLDRARPMAASAVPHRRNQPSTTIDRPERKPDL